MKHTKTTLPSPIVQPWLQWFLRLQARPPDLALSRFSKAFMKELFSPSHIGTFKPPPGGQLLHWMVQLTGVGYRFSTPNFPGCNQAFCWRWLFFSACLTLGLGFLMPTVLLHVEWQSKRAWFQMWNLTEHLKPSKTKYLGQWYVVTLHVSRFYQEKTEPGILSLLGLHAWMPIYSSAVLNLFPRHPVPRLRCQNNRQNNSNCSTQNSGLFSSKDVWHERMCTYVLIDMEEKIYANLQSSKTCDFIDGK